MLVLSQPALSRHFDSLDVSANRGNQPLQGENGEVEICGFEELDTTVTFSVEFEAELTEVIVVPNNLFPKPNTEQEASAALAPFVSVANLQAPTWDRFRYVFSRAP